MWMPYTPYTPPGASIHVQTVQKVSGSPMEGPWLRKVSSNPAARIYIYIYIYIYKNVYIYINVNIYIYIYIYTRVLLCIYMHRGIVDLDGDVDLIVKWIRSHSLITKLDH